MNENAQKWIADLRSGDFAQTKGVLTRLDTGTGGVAGNCCLGVACERYQREVGDLHVEDGIAVRIYERHSVNLPDKVSTWLGLDTADGRYCDPDPRGDEDYGYLTADNDNGKTFDEIADIIESEPKGLFREETP